VKPRRNDGLAENDRSVKEAGVKISIYDMDRTITRGGSWGPWLMFWLRREAPWRAVLLPLLALAMVGFGLGMIDRGQLKAVGHRLLMGRRVARARIAAAADAYADQVMAQRVFAGALSAIAADRAAGATLVLATASNQFYVDAIARRLGFDVVLATPSRWDGDWLTWRLGGPNCYGAAKDARVAAWLPGAGQPFNFTSDHESDLPVFERALVNGGAVVVANPSPAMRAIADQRRWPIVDWGVSDRSVWERA
jgi:HAD superfamily phosphoserine phosphatase-like hydrolase